MTKLETKVAARNEVNNQARAYVGACRAKLAPLVGQKIVLSNGGASAKFLKAIRSISLPINAYISQGHGYSVTANFRVCITNDAGTFYAEATVYLFDIDGATMKQNNNYLTHTDHLRTNYKADAIIEARREVAKARADLQNAENDLCYFGEND